MGSFRLLLLFFPAFSVAESLTDEGRDGMRPVVARDLLRIRTLGNPVADPEGSWVVLVERSLDTEKDRNQTRLLRWDLTHEAPVVLTHGPKDSNPAFSEDGRYLAFLGDRGEGVQVQLLPLAGGEPRALTHLAHGVSQFRWQKDGLGLFVVASFTEDRIETWSEEVVPSDPFVRFNRDVRVIERMFYKLDDKGYLGDRRAAVLQVDLETEGVRLLMGGPYDHALASPVPGRAAQQLVLTHRGKDPDREKPVRDVYRVDGVTGSFERVTDAGLGIEEALMTADGTLYVLGSHPDAHGYTNQHLYRLDPDGRGYLDLTAGLVGSAGDASVGDVPIPAQDALFLGPDGEPQCLWSERGEVGVATFGKGPGVRRITTGHRAVLGMAPLSGGRRVLAVTDPVTPSAVTVETSDGEEVARYDPNDGLNLAFSGVTLEPSPAPGDAWYMAPVAGRADPARDLGHGAEAGGDPLPAGSVPVVLEIHGGPAGMYGYRFHFEMQLLAAQGYAVVYGNPRGSTGYSDAFAQVIEADWGHYDYEDVMAFLDASLASHPELDGARMGVIGGSYGGFMVNWIVSHTSRFRAAVSGRSVVNRMSAMGTSDLGYLRIPQFGSPWWLAPAPYLHQSPLMWAENIETPLLLENQENDMRCPIEQAEQLYMALKVRSKTVRFVRYGGEFHGMSRTGRPWHRIHRLLEITTWFARYLGGAKVGGDEPRRAATPGSTGVPGV